MSFLLYSVGSLFQKKKRCESLAGTGNNAGCCKSHPEIKLACGEYVVFFPGKEGGVVFAALILLPRPLKLIIVGGR